MPVQVTMTTDVALEAPLKAKMLDVETISAQIAEAPPALPRPSQDIFSKQPIEIRLHILELMSPTNLDLFNLLRVSRSWRSTVIDLNAKFWKQKCNKLDVARVPSSDQTWYSLWLELMHAHCLKCEASTTIPFGVLCPEVPRWSVVCFRCRSHGLYSYFHVKTVRNKSDLAFLPQAEIAALPSRPSEDCKDTELLEYWALSIERLRLKQAEKIRALKADRKAQKQQIIARHPDIRWLARGLFETKTSPLYSSQWEKLQKRLLGTQDGPEESVSAQELADWAKKLVELEVQIQKECRTLDLCPASCRCLLKLSQKPDRKMMGKTWLHALLANKITVRDFVQQGKPAQSPSVALVSPASSWNTAKGVTPVSAGVLSQVGAPNQTIAIPTTFTLTYG